MRRNTRGARVGEQPEFVHQLRVGARRARVILKLFGKFIDSALAGQRARLDPVRTKALERDLRWVFRTLGEQRDRDVLLERLSVHASEVDVEPLQRELTRQRDRAARAVVRALASKRYQHVLRGLDSVLRALRTEQRSPRARKWAKKRMNKRLRGVLALREAVSGADDHARHELRKELKKLRYTAELVRGLYRQKRAKRYLATLGELQDALGALNDVATGTRLLDGATERLASTPRARVAGAASARKAAARASDGAAAKPARELVQHALEQVALDELEHLQPNFHAFEALEPFWK
jgi:CHAD domain-containing protein